MLKDRISFTDFWVCYTHTKTSIIYPILQTLVLILTLLRYVQNNKSILRDITSVARKQKIIRKVAKFRILKPAGNMTWKDLNKVLRDVRYRVYRLANLAVTEAYVNYCLWRRKEEEEYVWPKIGELAERLDTMLREESSKKNRKYEEYSKGRALPAYIYSALDQYTLRAHQKPKALEEVLRGKRSLATFRDDIAIPIRCDKPDYRRLERGKSGDVELDLSICRKPYPRIVLATSKLDGSQRTILERFRANPSNSEDDYRQRVFEVKQEARTGRWYLNVTFDFPASENILKPEIIVGVDIGYSLPLYAAINNGLARLGYRPFHALGNRIKQLRYEVMARRRSIQATGRRDVSQVTSRSGHGHKRKLLPTERLQGRINNAYRTLNHQFTAAVIGFARNHGAGTIQIEDLSGLKEELTGTFIGARWKYNQLQQFLKYKAEEAGILLREINPKYTSRRCSECGFINIDFDRNYRDKSSSGGKVAEFVCPKCDYKADPDYNAARNISTLDIENRIKLQCKKQGIKY